MRQPSAHEDYHTMFLFALYKKGPPVLTSLAKKRRYLDTHLKGELTDLF